MVPTSIGASLSRPTIPCDMPARGSAADGRVRRCSLGCGCGLRCVSRSTSRSGSSSTTPFWAGTSAAIVCQPHLGASLRKGWFRMIGTVVGAVAIVVLTACFPQDRAAVSRRLWRCGAPAALSSPRFCATLRPIRRRWPATRRRSSRATSSARPAARTGRPSCSPSPAPARSASASSAPASFSPEPISAAPGAGWPRCSRPSRPRSPAGSPARWRWPEPNCRDTQPVRRELVRRVIALDPVIDEAFGESSQLRYHSPVLQTAVDGLFAALASWRTVAVHLSAAAGRQGSAGGGCCPAQAFRRSCDPAPEQGDADALDGRPDRPAPGLRGGGADG